MNITNNNFNNAKIKAWDKQLNEGDRPYERFLIYLALGANRSLKRAWNIYKTREEGKYKENSKPSGTWERWFYDNKWKERAEAFDKQQAKKLFNSLEKKYKEQIEEHRAKRLEDAESIRKTGKRLLTRANKKLSDIDQIETSIIQLGKDSEVLSEKDLYNLSKEYDLTNLSKVMNNAKSLIIDGNNEESKALAIDALLNKWKVVDQFNSTVDNEKK